MVPRGVFVEGAPSVLTGAGADRCTPYQETHALERCRLLRVVRPLAPRAATVDEDRARIGIARGVTRGPAACAF